MVALSHDLLLPAGTASTLSAFLQCDVRRVMHTLHFSLCHANTNSSQDKPVTWPVSLLEQEIKEVKSLLYPNLFLFSLAEQLNNSPTPNKIDTSSLQRPWHCRDRVFKSTSKLKQCKYVNSDTMSDACDWLSHCDIINGKSGQMSVLDPNNAQPWWEISEKSCLLATFQDSLNRLEVEKLDKHKGEMTSLMIDLIGQNFGIKDKLDILKEENVVAIANKCRYCVKKHNYCLGFSLQ